VLRWADAGVAPRVSPPPRRWRRALAWLPIAVAIAAATSATAAGTAGSVSCKSGGTLGSAGNGWLEMRPDFRAGEPRVIAMASPAFDPNLLWATNGIEVARSQDTGCSWTIVYTAPAAAGGPPVSDSRITSLAAPSSANQSSFLYVGITESVQGVPQPTIVTTTDRGRSWTSTAAAGQSGLPALGAVTSLTVNSQVPQIAYALIDLTVRGVSRPAVYATTDGGATWGRRTDTTATADVTGLRSHPLQTSTVFAIAGRQASLSTDGGATFTPTPGLGAAVDALDVASGSGGARLAVALHDRAAVALSRDNGQSWTTLSAPAICSSIAVAPLQDLVAAADGGQLWLLTPTRRPVAVGPPEYSPVSLSITAPTAVGFSVTGLRLGAVVRATFSLNLQVRMPAMVNGQLIPIFLLPAGPVTQFPSTLAPDATRLVLPVGGRARVPYRLLLPRTPTPVDVMFLVDTTSSMQPVIDGLRQALAQIATTLTTTGLDVQFGLADFRDYPSPRGSAQAESDTHPADWPYRLDHRIGPVGGELAAALTNLRAAGGTTDGGQSALTALYQSTTGSGDLEFNETFVPPGQQAGYRHNSLKLAMLSTDTPPHYGGQRVKNQATPAVMVNNPGPGYAEVIQALLAHGVHQIGLAIDPGGGPSSRPALTRLASRTGALAPAGGVDCNGDGKVDVLTGGPLVCTVGSESTSSVTGTSTSVSASSLAAAVISLAANIPDVQPLVLQIRPGSAYGVVTSSPRAVNLHADNELAYTVEVHCPAHSAGVHRLRVDAATPTRSVAAAEIDLACVPPDAVPGIATTAPLAGVAIAPAPAPPATNPIPNANPNPNPNVNPAINTNVNPAVADQEQQQGQLAFAEADGIGRSNELAMSRLPTSRDAAFVAAGALLLGGASVAAVRRTRFRLATASACRRR
jgi:hypothetical protein